VRSPLSVLVLGDTHLGEDLARLPSEVWELADRADVVLHTGDVTSPALLDALAERSELHAVLGNNDAGLERRLPEEVRLDLGGVSLAMLHDSGPTAGRRRRLARRFPTAQLIVFGHSHQPLIDADGPGPVLLNPGSPTQRRREPVHTVAWVDIAAGEVRGAELVEVGPLATR
jgi:putative phosphoesterase